MVNDNLGHTFRDSITGFTGVATGQVKYITGCDQLLLVPPVDGEGKVRESQWFDVQRCQRQVTERVSVDNTFSSGPDKAAPKK
jgi:hypothetical protein